MSVNTSKRGLPAVCAWDPDIVPNIGTIRKTKRRRDENKAIRSFCFESQQQNTNENSYDNYRLSMIHPAQIRIEITARNDFQWEVIDGLDFFLEYKMIRDMRYPCKCLSFGILIDEEVDDTAIEISNVLFKQVVRYHADTVLAVSLQ